MRIPDAKIGVSELRHLLDSATCGRHALDRVVLNERNVLPVRGPDGELGIEGAFQQPGLQRIEAAHP